MGTAEYYRAVAPHYHLFYEHWWETVDSEGERLDALLAPRQAHTVLDASCGIGTQSIGLARQGYLVTACDESSEMVDEARRQAEAAGVGGQIRFAVHDMATLDEVLSGPFDAVISVGNSFPHLEPGRREQALRTFWHLLGPQGVLVIGMRNWDKILAERPQFVPRRVSKVNGHRLVMFDVWDYPNDGEITFTTFFLWHDTQAWRVETHTLTYYPLRAIDFMRLAQASGFQVVEQVDHSFERWWVLEVERDA